MSHELDDQFEQINYDDYEDTIQGKVPTEF